jgi:HAD superfamily hydrolase (TIGR01509 family)
VRSVHALIFDFDGLIVDTEWPAYVTAKDECEAHGLELTLAAWQRRIGRGDNEPWTALLDGIVDPSRQALIDERRRIRKDILTDAQPVLPGVVELLGQAGGLGLATAVASSSSLDWVARHLARVGLGDRFQAVRTRDDVVRAKPWPDLFLAAAEALGVDPARSIALEDSVHGVTAAKQAGMFCVAVPNRITAGGDFGAADLVLGSLADLDLAMVLST